MRRQILFVCLTWTIVATMIGGTSNAALTPSQKKELKEIGAAANKIGPMIFRQKWTDAESALTGIEERFANLVAETGLKDNDPALKPTRTQLDRIRKQLTKAIEQPVANFENTVAPILVDKCIECHGAEPKAGLRLDNFANLEKGGSGGPLLVPGEVESSLLMQRLLTNNELHRMPLGKEPLSENELHAFANWIAAGATFEGNKSATMTELAKSATTKKTVLQTKPAEQAKKSGKPQITKATGNETVHFMQDIMPEMVDVCGQCHNDRQKQSGFSVMSFEKLVKGGDSGAVITPGNLETSRLWRLVNADETPVMPAGNQTGITRNWHSNLRTWILEGAKFDGVDPKKPFPTRQERDAELLAKLTPDEWLDLRKKTADSDWKKAFSKTEPNLRETTEFLIYGDVSNERLERIEKWAGDQAIYLRQTFSNKEDRLWHGKLVIFVLKDRFGYEEFNTSVHHRDVPREMIGHSRISAGMEEAFIAVQDVGDSSSEASPGMQVNLIANVTSAYFNRTGNVPDWLISGSGLAIAHQKFTANPYFVSMPRSASRILQQSNLSEGEKIFEDGTFSPSDLSPVGCTLVEHLLKRGGINQFGKFVQKLQTGATVETSIGAVYRTDCRSMASAYLAGLPSSVKKGKK